KILPIVNTRDLNVREDYKRLYQSIIVSTFKDRPASPLENRIVVEGTSDIGKSSFLVYFIARLLYESGLENPPIVIFHKTGGSDCHVYERISTLRHGKINLSETWYLDDSSPRPLFKSATIIISTSPKTLVGYKHVTKEVVWSYYLALWDLDELKKCRSHIALFGKITEERPLVSVGNVSNIPRMQNQSGGRFRAVFFIAGLLLTTAVSNSDGYHRKRFTRNWMNNRGKAQLENAICGDGFSFKEYVAHVFRKGGHTFEIKELGNATPGGPTIRTYREPADFSALAQIKRI
ncbi:hypothetical protein BGZ65_002306, partial [Modicella reniformis]